MKLKRVFFSFEREGFLKADNFSSTVNCHSKCGQETAGEVQSCHPECLFSIDYFTMSLPDCVVIVRYNFLVVQLIRASVRYSGPVGLSYVMSTIQSAFSLTTLEKTQFQNLFDCKIWF